MHKRAPALIPGAAPTLAQFFLFCKYTDTDQRYSMRDNARHVAFMAHSNGDVEGRLD